MIKIVNIPNKIISQINSEIFINLSFFLNKKISSYDQLFKILKSRPSYRAKIFDLMNMLPVLSFANYEIKKILEKKINKKNLINWCYAQIRLDDSVSKNFSSPAHKDRWVLDKKKKGYVVWIPLKKNGSSLLLTKKDLTKKIKFNKYWGLEAVGPTFFYQKKIDFGSALIFDADTLHKSDDPKNSRVTMQLRYEEISKKNFKRSATQKIDTSVLNYWRKKLI